MGQMGDEPGLKRYRCWTAKRRAARVISLLKGDTTAAETAQCHELKQPRWRVAAEFLLGGERPARAAEGGGRAARGRVQSAQAQGGRADHGPGHSAVGCQGTPYDAGDVRRVTATFVRGLIPGERYTREG